MTKHEATVEVLTAEVRVLMVGSRQVTLSVYSQLDEVTPGQIKPFGRVRSKTASDVRVEVVGVDTDGQLCRSWVHYDGWRVGHARLTHLADIAPNPQLADRVCDHMQAWLALPLIVLAGLR